MQLLFTVFVMLAGQPQPVVMDYADLGDVTHEECRAQGEATASALMSFHPMCQARQCFTLLRCKDLDEGARDVVPEEAGDLI